MIGSKSDIFLFKPFKCGKGNIKLLVGCKKCTVHQKVSFCSNMSKINQFSPYIFFQMIGIVLFWKVMKIMTILMLPISRSVFIILSLLTC